MKIFTKAKEILEKLNVLCPTGAEERLILFSKLQETVCSEKLPAQDEKDQLFELAASRIKALAEFYKDSEDIEKIKELLSELTDLLAEGSGIKCGES